ncbi:MAG: zinc ribbon domain-containing protein [Pyrinomonadaceae bacterium]|nr:zinc ribbon domain-containing protein [Pyrinomonadaceae bacterium]
MAEIIVENQICESCGADVRPQALFCYNCGGSVAGQTEKTENNNGNNKIGDRLLRDDIKEEVAEKTQPVESGEVRKIEEKERILKDKKPDVFEEAKLKSAASLRRKAKSFQKKQVEIVWEEPENSSNISLILVALLLTVFAAAIVWLALYLK